MAGPGTVAVRVRAGAAQDSAGNQSAAGGEVSVSYQPESRLFLPMLSL